MEDDNTENNLLGIVSNMSHLQFVHFLNKTEHFNFIRNDDLVIDSAPEPIFLINFTYEDMEDGHICKLIKTKGLSGLLAKKMSALDYILIISSENPDEIINTLELLNGLPFIQAVMRLENKDIFRRDKKNSIPVNLLSVRNVL